MTKKGKIWTVAILILMVVLAIFIYLRFYFVFGEGVKNGTLNYIVHKGYIFKTYEGKIIQTGFRTNDGAIQSNEFMFSVADKEVAAELLNNQGNEVWLHYKEYFGRLPWRGYSKYIVDSISIVKTRPANPEQVPPMFQ